MNQQNQVRRESNIDRWETLRVLMTEKRTTSNGSEIEISLVVNQPTFKDGNEGYPKASVVVSRNGSMYRIPLVRGSSEEAVVIYELIGEALDVWDEGAVAEYEELVNEHRNILEFRRQSDSNGNVMGDNGDYEIPKRERRCRKFEQHRQDD